MKDVKHTPIFHLVQSSTSSEDESTPIKSSTTNLLYQTGKLPLISNRLLTFWPYTIGTNKGTEDKFLNFRLPNRALLLLLLYLLLNIGFFYRYIRDNFLKNDIPSHLFPKLDLVCFALWNLMIVAADTVVRFYGAVKLSKLKLFWLEVVDLVEQFNELISQEEIEERFKVIKKWGLKWIFGFSLLAAILIPTCAYYFLFASTIPKDPVTLVALGYMFFFICTNNVRAFLLIFFMKIITCGFSVCKTALQQASIEAEANTNDMILMEYIKRPTPGHKFGKSTYPNVNNFATKNKLDKILKLVEKLESSVANFNSLFGFILFVEVVLGVLQILFSMYFLHLDSVAQDITYYVIMVMQFTIYAVSVICLCIAASRLTMEAEDMIRKFQNLPSATLSLDVYKIQLLVSRLASNPPKIRVSNLFEIREALLGAALNTIATYFVVLVQMRIAYKDTK
ncbi:unnamed protein product [Orchesella dallaii]|uniref:Gustatory receptor n=1 Tax=Orchesella dallaii TaxID=48710 RepID=A0ABP1PWF9_9HEXA